jgi:hypothetical protein
MLINSSWRTSDCHGAHILLKCLNYLAKPRWHSGLFLITGVIRNVDHSTIADADEIVIADERRTSHASPGERYEDRVPYLAIRDCGRAYDGR